MNEINALKKVLAIVEVLKKVVDDPRIPVEIREEIMDQINELFPEDKT